MYVRVRCPGQVLAEDGQKMSKSKKNYPDPMHVVLGTPAVADQPAKLGNGADALRCVGGGRHPFFFFLESL